MADEFNPEAIDGDNDGIVQEGTEFERPVEELEIDPTLVEDEPAPVVEAEEVISAPEPVVSEEPALAPVANGVIGTGTKKSVKKTASKGDTSPKPEMVGIYSTKNVHWPSVGKIYIGLNIVTREQADKWLTRSHVREADPKDVAKGL